MMFWTRNRIKGLQVQAQESQGQIRKIFEESVITHETNHKAWGQYLKESRDNTQFGIYGTSAGIQVLQLAGYDALIDYAQRCLKQEVDTSGCRLHEKNDISITYKLSYLVEALPKQGGHTPENDALVQRLQCGVLPNAGWGEFYIDDKERDEKPQLTATATALLALHDCPTWHSQPSCERAVAWLAARVLDTPTLRISEVALAALALSKYKDVGERSPSSNVGKGLEACSLALERKVKLRGIEVARDIEVYSYSVPRVKGGIRENQYLFFVPDVLAATAILRTFPESRSPQSLKYVLNIVQFYINQVHKGGFTQEATGRISTVDHLWLNRLFQEFKNKPTDELVPSWWFRWRAIPLLLQFIGAVLLLAVGAIGFTYQENSASMPIKAAGFLAATLGTGIFISASWEAIKGRQ